MTTNKCAHTGRPIGSLLLIFLASCLLPLVSLCAAEDYVVAKVGETEIFSSQIDQEIQGLGAQQKESLAANPQGRSQFITGYVSGIALARRAEREGIEQDPVVREKLEKSRRGILANAVMQRKLASVTVDRQALEDYYARNQSTYMTPARVQLMYAHDADKAAMDQLVGAVRGGEIFERAAKGRFVFVPGWIERTVPFVPGLNDIVEAKDVDALFELPQESVSEPVTGKDGRSYVFFVVKKEGSFVEPFERVASRVEADCRNAKVAEAADAYMRETFEQEGVVIFSDEKEQ